MEWAGAGGGARPPAALESPPTQGPRQGAPCPHPTVPPIQTPQAPVSSPPSRAGKLELGGQRWDWGAGLPQGLTQHTQLSGGLLSRMGWGSSPRASLSRKLSPPAELM